MEKPIFNKPRRYTALGFTLLAAGGMAELAQAGKLKNSDPQTVGYYQIDKDQSVYIEQMPGAVTANTYVSVANIKQTVKDAEALAAQNLAFNVEFTGPNGPSIANFRVVKSVAEPLHTVYILPDANDVQTASSSPIALPGATNLDALHASVDTFIAPVGAEFTSSFGDKFNPDVLNVAEQLCLSTLDVDIGGLAGTSKILGYPARAEQLIDVSNGLKNGVCITYSVATAARTANLPYRQYVSAMQGQTLDSSLTGSRSLKFSMSYPVLPKASYLDLNPLTFNQVA